MMREGKSSRMAYCSFASTCWCVEITQSKAATQQAAVADAAARPQDRALFDIWNRPERFPALQDWVLVLEKAVPPN